MPATEKRFGCLGVFIVALLCLSLLFNFVFVVGEVFSMASVAPRTFRETLRSPGAANVKTKVAIIRLGGLITSGDMGFSVGVSPEDVRLQFQQAMTDPNVKAIVLAIDSPGGEVTASDDIYNIIRRARDTKPVIVSMGAMAASGGYYAALGGSHILARDTTFTGSIGVIMQTLNYADLFGKVGLQMVTFKSGKMKDMLSGSRPITPEESEYVQALVMQTYAKFVGIVAAERKIPEDVLRNGVADGRVISGKDALEARLIDELGDMNLAITRAMEKGQAPGAAVVEYQPIESLGRLLRIFGRAQASRKVEINLGTQASLLLQPGRLYLLPEILAP